METESVINGSHQRKVRDLMTSLPSSTKKNFKKKKTKEERKRKEKNYDSPLIIRPYL